MLEKKPNPAHFAIADLEKRFKHEGKKVVVKKYEKKKKKKEALNSTCGSSRESGANKHTENDLTMYVSGLSNKVQEKDIKDYFAGFGKVASVNLIVDQMTGRSRGFAFVVFNEVKTLNTVRTVIKLGMNVYYSLPAFSVASITTVVMFNMKLVRFLA